jgi:hypothetical protein
MSIVRSFGANGQFELVDWTQELNVIPNSWGTIAELGIFQEEPVAEHVVTFEKITKDGALIVDRVRGDRSNVNKDYAREIHTFAVPHFPLSDYISPNDIQGKRAYGNPNDAETIAFVRARKMERIAQDHNWTLEAARAQALILGTAYAPNATVSQNWFTEFSKTQTVVDFAFSSSTTDVLGQIETVIAAIQDNGGMISLSGIVVLCSPQWFAPLISHATTKTAFQYYTSTQSPLRDRLADTGAPLNALAMHREFQYGGVRFIEMRDAYNGTALIPANTAVAVPTGTPYFKTYFSPANRFFLTNTLGERQYMFETPSIDGTEIRIDTESNHISALLRPELVIKLTKS